MAASCLSRYPSRYLHKVPKYLKLGVCGIGCPCYLRYLGTSKDRNDGSSSIFLHGYGLVSALVGSSLQL